MRAGRALLTVGTVLGLLALTATGLLAFGCRSSKMAGFLLMHAPIILWPLSVICLIAGSALSLRKDAACETPTERHLF